MSNTLVACIQCEKLNRVETAETTSKTPICGSCQSTLPFHDGTQQTSDTALAKLIKGADKPVVVDFWAEWCGPCKVFAPIFSTAAKELGSHFIFVKVDTEKYPSVTRNHRVMGIPTIVVFKDGGELDRRSGALPLHEFKNYLMKYSK